MTKDTKYLKPEIPFSHRFKKRLDLVIKKKKIVFLSLVSGLLIAAIISFLLPKQYRATGKVFFQYNSVYGSLLNNNGSLDNELNLLTSDKLLKNCVDYLAEKGIHVSVNDILESQELIVEKITPALDVNIVVDEANKAAEIANSLLQTFSEICALHNKTPFISALKMISDKEKSLQDDIKDGLAAQQVSQINALTGQQERIITQISEYESELESIELDNYFYTANMDNLQKILEEKYPQISSSILIFSNVELSGVKEKLERLYTKQNLSSISKKLGNPQIKYPWTGVYQLSDIESTKNEFNKNLRNFISETVKNKDIDGVEYLKNLSEKLFENQIMVNSIDLTKSIIFNTLTDLEERFNFIPFDFIDIARQSRMQNFNNGLLLKLKNKKLNMQNRENEFYADIESIRTADIPKTYFSPTPTLNIFLGGLIGLIFGLVFAVSSSGQKIELIQSTEDLEEVGYKIISQIPYIANGSSLLLESANKDSKQKIDPKILDSFSSIETFLQYGSLEKPLKTVLITSGQDGEGKSVIASNVAISLAHIGDKVLLVDADLKHPKLNKYFKVKSTPSLAHYLFRKKELNEIIRSTHIKNLDLITCIEFPQNPSVIITSERMKNFMEQVEKKYDFIVYDSSSLCSLKETASLAKNMDKVILVVRSNKTTLSEILTAESVLRENGVEEFNVVLNDVKS